jgi:PAS domain S-box-containing protein
MKFFKRTSIQLIFVYIVASAIWLLFSNYLITLWFEHAFFRPDFYKDILFVASFLLITYIVVKSYHKKLRQSEQQYKNFFENNPIPMWIFDKETLAFVKVNDAAVNVYGYSEQEFLTMTIKDIRPQEEVARLHSMVSTPRQPYNPAGIWKHKTKTGKIISVQITSHVTVFNGRKCRLVLVHDVTEMMETKEENSKLALVAKNTSNSVIITNKKREIEWVNEAFTVQAGYSFEEVRGKDPFVFLYNGDNNSNVLDELSRSLHLKKEFTGEILIHNKNDSRSWVKASISPVYIDGELQNFVIVQTDITQTKLQEEKIGKQNKRLKEIAFMSSHNTRKPLANILASMNLIDRKNLTDAFNEPIFQVLENSAKELDEVVHQIVARTAEVENSYDDYEGTRK